MCPEVAAWPIRLDRTPAPVTLLVTVEQRLCFLRGRRLLSPVEHDTANCRRPRRLTRPCHSPRSQPGHSQSASLLPCGGTDRPAGCWMLAAGWRGGTEPPRCATCHLPTLQTGKDSPGRGRGTGRTRGLGAECVLHLHSGRLHARVCSPKLTAGSRRLTPPRVCSDESCTCSWLSPAALSPLASASASLSQTSSPLPPVTTQHAERPPP